MKYLQQSITNISDFIYTYHHIIIVGTVCTFIFYHALTNPSRTAPNPEQPESFELPNADPFSRDPYDLIMQRDKLHM